MLTLVCSRCNIPAAHRLVQRSRWFTLFFIPVIPFSFTRHTVCAYCGGTQKVSKQDAAQIVAGTAPTPLQPLQAGAAMPPQAQPGQLNPPQF